MSETYENKSPEQIQRDIERTRAEMGNTLDTIRQKLSPGQMLDEALDYLKGSVLSQFSSNLGETVQHNPIPVSLIGVGIAWLAMAGSRPSNASTTWTTTGRAHSRIGEVAGSVAARTGQVVQGTRVRVGETRERVGEMAQNVQERVGEARERLGDMAYNAGHQVGEAADRLRHQTQYQAARARDTYYYLRNEQPLVLGILGLAVGALLGAGLPPTRQEDELLGEMRDEYVHRAREAGEEYLEQGKRMVTAAGEAVKEQAEKAGLTPDGQDQQVRNREEDPACISPVSHYSAQGETTKPGIRS
jgi:ElaB/YqjD/DUF883 family membrane-anchored ribosome-binding protein